nr:biotin-independent malonate decarboxylase subunit beta [Hartmannibacter diazotrophicus]
MDRDLLSVGASWFLSTARERLDGFLDAGSFVEVLPPTERQVSPHLDLFGLPAAFDDGMIVGRGRLGGREILVAAQEGQFMGGTFAEVSGAKLVGLLRAAALGPDRPAAVCILFDSGGVRLQEANAGELAVAEVMRAIFNTRRAGIPVIALVGGRAGAFGGAGLAAATCSSIVICEQGRTGVSGPEVIETNEGVEEFDSRDKALVWGVTGGRARRILGGADIYVEDGASAFRAGALAALEAARVPDLSALKAEQRRLANRISQAGDARSVRELWSRFGIADAEAARNMSDPDFQQLVSSVQEGSHAAR